MTSIIRVRLAPIPETDCTVCDPFDAPVNLTLPGYPVKLKGESISRQIRAIKKDNVVDPLRLFPISVPIEVSTLNLEIFNLKITPQQTIPYWANSFPAYVPVEGLKAGFVVIRGDSPSTGHFQHPLFGVINNPLEPLFTFTYAMHQKNSTSKYHNIFHHLVTMVAFQYWCYVNHRFLEVSWLATTFSEANPTHPYLSLSEEDWKLKGTLKITPTTLTEDTMYTSATTETFCQFLLRVLSDMIRIEDIIIPKHRIATPDTVTHWIKNKANLTILQTVSTIRHREMYIPKLPEAVETALQLVEESEGSARIVEWGVTKHFSCDDFRQRTLNIVKTKEVFDAYASRIPTLFVHHMFTPYKPLYTQPTEVVSGAFWGQLGWFYPLRMAEGNVWRVLDKKSYKPPSTSLSLVKLRYSAYCAENKYQLWLPLKPEGNPDEAAVCHMSIQAWRWLARVGRVREYKKDCCTYYYRYISNCEEFGNEADAVATLVDIYKDSVDIVKLKQLVEQGEQVHYESYKNLPPPADYTTTKANWDYVTPPPCPSSTPVSVWHVLFPTPLIPLHNLQHWPTQLTSIDPTPTLTSTLEKLLVSALHPKFAADLQLLTAPSAATLQGLESILHMARGHLPATHPLTMKLMEVIGAPTADLVITRAYFMDRWAKILIAALEYNHTLSARDLEDFFREAVEYIHKPHNIDADKKPSELLAILLVRITQNQPVYMQRVEQYFREEKKLPAFLIDTKRRKEGIERNGKRARMY